MFEDPEWFSPVYTHQLFSQEFITGYTNLSIKMYFAQPTLKCLVEVKIFLKTLIDLHQNGFFVR